MLKNHLHKFAKFLKAENFSVGQSRVGWRINGYAMLITECRFYYIYIYIYACKFFAPKNKCFFFPVYGVNWNNFEVFPKLFLTLRELYDYRVLVGKPEGKRPLGRPRRRWVDNIRMDLQEVVCGYMDWIGRAQDRDRWRRLVSAVMNLRVPWNAGNFLTSCKPVSFSRRTLHHGVSK